MGEMSLSVIDDHHMVMKEKNASRKWARFVLSFIGLLLIGGFVTMGMVLPSVYEMNLRDTGQMAMTACFIVAALGFGVASLLSWRQKGERQAIVIKNNMVKLQSSKLRQPLFSASIEHTKFQRFQRPDGKQQLFLRAGERAVEVGQRLPMPEQNLLATELEKVLGVHAPLGFSRRKEREMEPTTE